MATHLIMREAKTGLPVSIPISSIPEWLHPSKWEEQLSWQFNNRLTKTEVMSYISETLGGPRISPELAKRMATYCVDYAKMIVVCAMLMGGGPEHAEANRKTIEKVNKILEHVKSGKEVGEILDELLAVAIDPL